MNKIKLQPVKGFQAFSNAFTAGKKFHTERLTASFCYGDNPALEQIKQKTNTNSDVTLFGITVAKKRSKKAVVRNRIKRLLRQSVNEIFNKREAGLAGGKIGSVIITWKTAPSHPKLISLNIVKQDVEAVIFSALSYYERNYNQNIANDCHPAD